MGRAAGGEKTDGVAGLDHVMERILEGSLTCFVVPDILTFLNMGTRNGCLVLERPTQETKVFFRDGQPVFANSTREDLRLGNMLVRAGKVKAEELARILKQKATAGHRIGQILLAEGVLRQEELASFLKVQVSETIFDTFTWNEGVFTFFHRVPPPATAVTLVIDTQNLIMEGVRRIDERSRLAEVFPDRDAVPVVVANPERVKQSVTLTQEEWRAFFLVDGRRSLAEICRLAGEPDELSTLETLHNLIVAKFLTLLPPVSPVHSDGTQKVPERAAPEPAGRPPVEFRPAVAAPNLAEDTKDVVRPQAIPYLSNTRNVTVSRLVLFGAGGESSFPLTRDTYTLGRHCNNDIVVNDPKVSSFHARIDRRPEGFVLVDLGSRNGSYINGKRSDSGLLKTGDEVRLGTARLIYKVDYTSSVE